MPGKTIRRAEKRMRKRNDSILIKYYINNIDINEEGVYLLK